MRGSRNVGGAMIAGVARESKRPKNFFDCGGEGHFTGDKRCLARDQACRKCGKIGHFQI